MAKQKSNSQPVFTNEQIEQLIALGFEVEASTTEEEVQAVILQALKDDAEITDLEGESFNDILEIAVSMFPDGIAGVSSDEENDEIEESDDDEIEESDDEVEDEQLPVKEIAKKRQQPAATAKKPAATKKAPVQRAPASEAYYLAEKGLEPLEGIVDIFKGKDLTVTQLKQGITVRLNLSAKKRPLISYDKIRIVDGKIVGDLFFNILKGREETEKKVNRSLIGDEEDYPFKNFNSNLIYISKVTIDQVSKIMTPELVTFMLRRAESDDVKLANARKALEARVEKGDAPVEKGKGAVTAKKTIKASDDLAQASNKKVKK